MLSDLERAYVQQVFGQGVGALRDEGWADPDILEFLTRPDVQAEMHLLQREFDSHAETAVRGRFLLQRGVTGLMPGAVSVLASSLAGHIYARDSKGTILLDGNGNPVIKVVAPSKEQLKAATVVLDYIDEKGAPKGPGSVDHTAGFDPAGMLEAAQTRKELNYGDGLDSLDAKTLFRERLRVAMQRFGPGVTDAHQRLCAGEAIDATVVKSKKKVAKKKVVKKVAKKKVVKKVAKKKVAKKKVAKKKVAKKKRRQKE